MARRGVAGYGEAGKAGQRMARRGMVRPGEARQAMRFHRPNPETIVIAINNQEHGCESCQWHGWKHNTTGGKRTCEADQPAFPNGSKATCIQWYKPRTKRGNGRGRTVNSGGVR